MIPGSQPGPVGTGFYLLESCPPGAMSACPLRKRSKDKGPQRLGKEQVGLAPILSPCHSHLFRGPDLGINVRPGDSLPPEEAGLFSGVRAWPPKAPVVPWAGGRVGSEELGALLVIKLHPLSRSCIRLTRKGSVFPGPRTAPKTSTMSWSSAGLTNQRTDPPLWP